MRISDWSSDVCSSDLAAATEAGCSWVRSIPHWSLLQTARAGIAAVAAMHVSRLALPRHFPRPIVSMHANVSPISRSEEHTSELQSLMRISYAVFCLKQNKNQHIDTTVNPNTQQ